MIVNYNFPIAVCIEGIDGSGKTTLIKNIREKLVERQLAHDVYIDRFVMSNRWYNVNQGITVNYDRLENSLVGKAIYLYLDVDSEVACRRLKEKQDHFSYSVLELSKMRDYYLRELAISKLPVLMIQQSYDVCEVIDKIDNHRMMLAVEQMAEKSACLKRKNGSALCSGNNLVSLEYNRVPVGCAPCKECLRVELSGGYRLEVCRSVHAEMLAINQGEGNILYTKYFPCSICARLMIEHGVIRIYYRFKDPDIDTSIASNLFEESGVVVEKL